MEVAAGAGAGAGVGSAVPERRGWRGRRAGTVAAVMADELLAAAAGAGAGGVAVHWYC